MQRNEPGFILPHIRLSPLSHIHLSPLEIFIVHYVSARHAMYVTKHEARLVQDKFEFYSALQLELKHPPV